MTRSATTAGLRKKRARPQVSVMIVAYNSREQITRCIESARAACQSVAAEFLLIDNGADGTGEHVTSQFPDVRVIPSRGNVGFGRAMNLLAVEARAPHLVLLNPDMFLLPRAIDHLHAAKGRDPSAGAWGGVSLDEAGAIDSGNCIEVPSLRTLAASALGRSPAGRLTPVIGVEDMVVPVLSGAFAMVSREAWDRVGGFDESFFLYCEEVDLFARMRAEAYRLWRIGKARGTHQSGHGDPLSSRRMLLRAAGIMHYAHKHWSPPAAWLGAALFWIAATERFMAGKLVGSRNDRLRRIGAAYQSVVFSPTAWFRGYDRERGLLAARRNFHPD